MAALLSKSSFGSRVPGALRPDSQSAYGVRRGSPDPTWQPARVVTIAAGYTAIQLLPELIRLTSYGKGVANVARIVRVLWPNSWRLGVASSSR